MRRRYSREQWRSFLREQAASGLSVSAFCLQNDVPENSFCYWRKKFASEESQSVKTEPLFVPVSVVSRSDFEVQFPSGVSMRVPRDAEAVRWIVDALADQSRQGGDECSA